MSDRATRHKTLIAKCAMALVEYRWCGKETLALDKNGYTTGCMSKHADQFSLMGAIYRAAEIIHEGPSVVHELMNDLKETCYDRVSLNKHNYSSTGYFRKWNYYSCKDDVLDLLRRQIDEYEHEQD